MSAPDVRRAFEAWVELRWHPDAGRGTLDRDDRGGYYNTAVEYAWRAWKASRAELAAPVSPPAPRGEAPAAKDVCAKCRPFPDVWHLCTDIPAAPANDAVREAAKAVVAREREISWDEEPESLTKAIYALHIALAAERAERERGGDRG